MCTEWMIPANNHIINYAIPPSCFLSFKIVGYWMIKQGIFKTKLRTTKIQDLFTVFIWSSNLPKPFITYPFSIVILYVAIYGLSISWRKIPIWPWGDPLSFTSPGTIHSKTAPTWRVTHSTLCPAVSDLSLPTLIKVDRMLRLLSLISVLVSRM